MLTTLRNGEQGWGRAQHQIKSQLLDRLSYGLAAALGNISGARDWVNRWQHGVDGGDAGDGQVGLRSLRRDIVGLLAGNVVARRELP